MKKIVLVCAGGMSTGVLVNNMKQAAQKKAIPVSIDAFSIESVASVAKDAAKLIVVVVFPTPPFWFASAIIFPIFILFV